MYSTLEAVEGHGSPGLDYLEGLVVFASAIWSVSPPYRPGSSRPRHLIPGVPGMVLAKAPLQLIDTDIRWLAVGPTFMLCIGGFGVHWSRKAIMLIGVVATTGPLRPLIVLPSRSVRLS